MTDRPEQPSPEKDADALLVERVQRGDQRAFELLVTKYERKVMRLIARMVRNEQEVQDVAQDTFIRAYRALPNFRGESAFYTWLYRIAVNTAKNHLAANSRRMEQVFETSDEDSETYQPQELLSDVDTPESVLASRQIGDTVNAAVQALPEDLRTAVTLREIEGMSYEEIAAVMNCPIGTVRSRIFRAREAIAAKLRPLLDTKDDQRW